MKFLIGSRGANVEWQIEIKKIATVLGRFCVFSPFIRITLRDLTHAHLLLFGRAVCATANTSISISQNNFHLI